MAVSLDCAKKTPWCKLFGGSKYITTMHLLAQAKLLESQRALSVYMNSFFDRSWDTMSCLRKRKKHVLRKDIVMQDALVVPVLSWIQRDMLEAKKY